MLHKRACAVALATGTIAVGALGGTAVAQVPSTANTTAAVTCVGTSFSGTLSVNRALCNGSYKLTMQDNGDLVLRDRHGRACYASGSRAPGDAYASFHKNLVGVPYIDIISKSQGRVGRILGAHSTWDGSPNASLNNKGEFWVGYKKVGWC
ncbi:hypothetical protein [Streptomyces chumphonensis]|uniref:hypothetical protein n=1 Tax=Streptomyces chumphonensis TaxID=1214925 RepID=UPI003D73A5E7